MPKEFTKDIGDAGKFFTESGVVEVTRNDQTDWVDAFHDMQTAGLEVPAPWAHPEKTDDKGYPVDGRNKSLVKQREGDKLQAGWVNDIFFDDAGKLQCKVEVVKDEDVRQVETVGTFVSPQFGPWTNPLTGKRYPKAITHIALTPRPVNPLQSKQWLATQALSLDAATQDGQVQAVTVQMGDSIVSGEVRTDGDNLPNGANPDGTPRKPSKKDRIRDCLREHFGIVVENPSDLDTLLAAVESAAAAKDVGQAKKPGSSGTGGKKTDPIRTEPSTVLVMSQLSQDAKAKLDAAVAAGTMTTEARDAFVATLDTMQFSADIEKKHPPTPEPPKPPVPPPTPSPETVQMAQAVSAMNERLTAFQRKDYADRIKSCLRQQQCSPQQAEMLTQQANTFQFSTDKQTDPILEGQLKILEANQPGLLLTHAHQQQMAANAKAGKVFTEPDNAFFRDQDIPAAEAEKIVADEMKAHGLAPAVAAAS